MNKYIYLFLSALFFIVLTTELQAQCPAPACTQTAVSGSNYTLTATDVLCISSNFASGNISINGGTVLIQSGGTLSVNPNLTTGVINIASGGTLNSDISANTSAVINNCGIITGTRSINKKVTINNYGNNGGVLLSLKQDNGFTLNNFGKNLSLSIDGNPNESFTINNAAGASITSLRTTHPKDGLKPASVITNLGDINIGSEILWEGTINNGSVSGSQPGKITSDLGYTIEFRGPWTINNNISSTIQLDKIYLNNLQEPAGKGALLSDQSVLAVNTIIGNNIVNPVKGIGGCSYFKSYDVKSSTSNQNLFLQKPPGSISYCGPVPTNEAAQTFGIISIVSNGDTPAKYRVTVNSSDHSSEINNIFISIRNVQGNQANGYWKAKLISTASGTATYDLISPNGGDYTFDTPATPGTGTFYWTPSTFGNAYYAGYDCNNPSLTTKIVSAGPAQSVCANDPTVTLAGNFSSAPGIIWSGGAGTFVPNNTTKNATYTPTAAEITAGLVTLTITTTGAASACNQQSDRITITYDAAPTVDAGDPASSCANNASIALVGKATNQTGVLWSGGSGTFSPTNSLSTTYTPSAAEKIGAPKTITLTLTATKLGCKPVKSLVDITINPAPIVNAGLDRTICKNDSVNLAGKVTNATGGTWYGGTGKFLPNANTLNANYKPSAAELKGSGVKLILKSTGNGSCLEVTDTMFINFTPAPTALIQGPKNVCANNPNIDLKSTITAATGQLWIGNGGSFIVSTTAKDVTYVPSADEILMGFTGVALQTTGGNCPPITDTIYIDFNPAPIVDAGPPISICENNPTGKLTGSVSGISTVTWSSPTGGLFSAPTNPITNYSVTAADILSGSVTLTVTANKATCKAVTDNVIVTITPKPTVSAGPTRSVCRNNPTATFNGSVTGPTGIGVQWSTTGDGSFGTATNLNTTYTAGPNDLIAGTVTLKITTTSNGNCSPEFSTTTMTFTPTPVVTPGNYTVCANNPVVSLKGTVTIASGGTWTGGLGTFSPNRNSLTATYTPTATEAAGTSLTLTLESTGNGNCVSVKKDATITFTPAPTITPLNPVNVCADVPTAAISTTNTISTGVLWTGGSGTILSPTSGSTTYTPTLAEITSGSVTLTVTTTGNGTCSPVFTLVKILIAPAPTIDAGPNQIVCGTVSTVSNLSGKVTGATGGKWSIVSGTGTISNVNTLSSTYTPSNQDIINGSVTLKLSSTGNGSCKEVSNDMKITYTPEPSINAGVNQTVCSTELPVLLSATGSPSVWATSGGSFGNTSSLKTTYTPSAAEIAAGTLTLSISTIASGACPVKTDKLIITIPQGPSVNPGPANQSLCGSLAAYQLTGTVKNATGGIWSTSGTGSFLPDANQLNATYSPSAIDRTNGSVILTLTSIGNGQCLQVSKDITLTITKAITTTAGPNQTLCADVSGITLNGSVSNATGILWTITSGSGTIGNPTDLITNYKPSAADITAGTVSFKITTTGNNGCPEVSSNVTHTLTPAPTLNQGSDQSICGDSAYVQLNAVFTVATGVIWSSSGTGTFNPNAVTANARYYPSTADVINGNIIITATTTGNGTCTALVKKLSITITPAVSVTIPTNQTVCENKPIVNLVATTASTVVSWTTSGTGTFADPASPSTTYTPSKSDISKGIVTLINKTIDNGNCKTKTGKIQVTIAPSPIVDAGFPQTVCSTISSIKLNGSVENASGGTWTSNGTGVFANATNPITTYAPSKADTTAGSILFTLTSTGNGSCIPVAKNVLVTFKKLPKVDAGPDQLICGDSAYVQLLGSVVNAGGGLWSVSAGTGLVLPTATDLNASYSPSKTDKLNGSVMVTLTSTSNGECPAVTDVMKITITEAPVVSVSSDKTVCANNAVINVSGTNNGVSSNIKWTTSGTGTFAPNNNTLLLTYTPSAIDKAAGSVILALTTLDNGTCKPAQAFIKLTITPAPTLNAGFDKSICADSLEIKLDQALVTNASGVKWTTSGSGVFGANDTIIQPTYYPTIADKATGIVKLAVITTGNGLCLPVKDTIIIKINPKPTVNAGSDRTICADTSSIKLSGSSTIAGGVKWTSTGAGTFTPSEFDANATYTPSDDQTFTLSLTTINNGTCKAVKDDILVIVEPIPLVDAGIDTMICADVNQLPLKGIVSHAMGGLWTTNGSGTFTPNNLSLNSEYIPSTSDITVGNVVLTLFSTGNGFCKPVKDDIKLTFNPITSLSAGNDLQICKSATTVDINGNASNVTGVQWEIITGSGSLSSTSSVKTTYNVSPADISAGTVTLKLTGTALSGCTNASDLVLITFVDKPPIDAGLDKTVCDTDVPIIQLEGSGSPGKWKSLSAGIVGTFLPNEFTLNATYTPSAAEIATGSITLKLETLNDGGCGISSDEIIFKILKGPEVNAGTAPNICANSTSVNLTGTTNGISATGVTWFTSGSGTFLSGNTLTPTYSPSASDKIGGKVILTISTIGTTLCKPVIDTVHLQITPAPMVSTGTDQIVCGDASSVNISSTFSNATGVIWKKATAKGSFVNATSANTSYVVTPSDTIAPASITIEVSTTGQLAGCPPATDLMTISFSKVPTVTAGLPITVCTDTTSIPLNGKVNIANGGIWSSASGGSFTPSASNLNALYIPSVLDKANGSVKLTLTTTGNGSCKAYPSEVLITLNPEPTISGTVPNDSICKGNTVSASVDIDHTTSVIWKTTGTGNFSNSTAINTVYTPSLDDVTKGGFIIYASTVGSNPCKEVETYFAITILKNTAALVNAGFDQIACSDAGFFPLNGIVEGSGTGIWTSSTGRGDFYPDATDLNPTFVPADADINAGGLKIILTPTNPGLCPAKPDTMLLTITKAPKVKPTASPGGFPALCSDTAFIQLSPVIENATGGVWSTTGTGIFSPSISTENAIYVPSAEDRKKGKVALTITSTGNQTCEEQFGSFELRLTPKPTIDIGPDKIICADQSVDLKALITVAKSVDWSTSGSGNLFPESNSITTQYFLSDADTTNGVLNIIAKSINQGLCKPVFDTLRITIKPLPLVIASADQSICADAGVVIVSSKIFNATGVNWTTNGSGSFTPNSSGNPVTYTISQADTAKGSVKLFAHSVESGICTSSQDSLEILITPVPLVRAGAPIICETLKGSTLNGSIISNLVGTATWSANGAGVFAINNSTLNATYYPTAADIKAGFVTLTLKASNFGTCKADSSKTTLKIEALPKADAGKDQYSCKDGSVTVSANDVENGVIYSWSDGIKIVEAANSKTHTFKFTVNTKLILLAQDTKGCISSDTVGISLFDLPKLASSDVCYTEDLLIKSKPTPEPTVPGMYQWFDHSQIMTGENKQNLVVPDTGIYIVEFAFANCKSSGKIKVNPIPIIKASDIIACGNGELTASTIPNNATILWTKNGTLAGGGKKLPILSDPNDTIKYKILVRYPLTNCPAEDSVYVIGLPIPEMISLDSTSCTGSEVALSAVPKNITNLNQFLQLTYDWRKDGGKIFSTEPNIIVSAAGVYKGAITIDQCKDTSSNVIGFESYPTSDLPDSYEYCPETDLTVSLNPGTRVNTSYLWNNKITTPINVVSPQEDSMYVVTITNQFNCSITDQTNVYTICAPHIDVPTAFTPGLIGSGDQLFRGYGKYEQNYKLIVFNRWGEIMFITTDKNITWDGTYLGEPMLSGVYPWILTYEGRGKFKGPYKQSGAVTIIR